MSVLASGFTYSQQLLISSNYLPNKITNRQLAIPTQFSYHLTRHEELDKSEADLKDYVEIIKEEDWNGYMS